MMLHARPYIAIVAALALLFLLWRFPQFNALRETGHVDVALPFVPGTPKSFEPYTKTDVVARTQSESVDWLEEAVDLGVSKAVYVVDNPTLSPDHQVPANKGHEAMVYLTYIIDHYDDLADISIFVHAHQIAWHNNDLLDSDMVKTIRHLSEAHVTRVGYFNLRCHHEPGCPDWLHLDRPKDQLDTFRKMEEHAFSLSVWAQLHPHTQPPRAISQPCCAQFAVSRDRIRAIPRAEYVRYRDWLLTTELEDKLSGRVMEYSWQFIFAGVPELCPEMHVCYCDGYGVCFGGAGELQHWLEIREKMRALDADANELLPDSGQASQETERKVAQIRSQARELDAQLLQLKLDAFRRGQDAHLRALEVGRPWDQGDGF
ncbi:hypothetical protein RBB50_011469 [Rhinocladiella similis]